MYRARPLLNMLARVLLAGIAVETARSLILPAAALGFGRGASVGELARDAVLHGGLTGLLLAAPMIFVTIACFRQIRRPFFYRFAMVTVALIVIMETWLRPSASFVQHALFSPGSSTWMLTMIAVMLVSQALLAYACSLAARIYVREFYERQLARQAHKQQ